MGSGMVLLWFCNAWQRDVEGRACAEAAANCDLAAVLLDDAVAD
jgi:hypothetical protein